MATITLIMGFVSVSVSMLMLWAQPRRYTNQIFALLWITLGVWFLCVHGVARSGLNIAAGKETDLVFWLRLNASVAALFPSLIWWLKETIILPKHSIRPALFRSAAYLIASFLIVPLCWAPSFVIGGNTENVPLRGTAYFIYIVILILLLLGVVVDVSLRSRSQTGIRRVELQFLAMTMAAACLGGTICVGLGNYLRNDVIRNGSIFVFISSYAVTAWAITAHRIFNTKQVLVAILHRTIIGAAMALSLLLVSLALAQIAPIYLAILTSAALTSLGIPLLDRRVRQWLRVDGIHKLSRIRAEVIRLSRIETNPDRLTKAFERLLATEFNSQFATLAFLHNDLYSAGRLRIGSNHAAFHLVTKLGWVTPESLERRRQTEGLDELKQFLSSSALSAIVATPVGSARPSMLVGLGANNSGWPFTYPEIETLQRVAELMDNILTHARLSAQAAQQSRTEHLAMMSRGLAHDLKNLLTPVSTFLVHTGGRYSADTPEAEVHAAAQRSIRLMSDYVREAGFFADRLAPRLEHTTLRRIFAGVRDATTPRAETRGMQLLFTCDDERPVTVDGILVQRLIANLVFNAIDASLPESTITIAGGVTNDHARVDVVDSGRGIPPENLGRIFEPYFTTKEFGEETRGFGLGLTICQKIAALHHGSLTVESAIGRGTTFSFEFPSLVTSSAPTDTDKPTEDAVRSFLTGSVSRR